MSITFEKSSDGNELVGDSVAEFYLFPFLAPELRY